MKGWCQGWNVGKTVLAAVLGLGGAIASAADPAPDTYLARLAAARIPAEAAAVVIKPLDDGALRWSANDRKPMNPASTMKLVTTYSALHLLGPAFTFSTSVRNVKAGPNKCSAE